MRLTLLLLFLAFSMGGYRQDSPVFFPTKLTTFETVLEASNEKNAPVNSSDETATGEIYICQSKGAKRYHKRENCHGLRNCTHTIKKTTIAAAENLGLTPCKLEY